MQSQQKNGGILHTSCGRDALQAKSRNILKEIVCRGLLLGVNRSLRAEHKALDASVNFVAAWTF